VPAYAAQVDFTMVNNLIAALGTDSAELLVDYLERYDPQALECHEVTRSLVEKGLNYYRDFVLPGKTYRRPDEEQRRLLRRLRDLLAVADPTDEESLQALPFDLARENGLEPKELFRIFYEVVLGQERGPRFGSFVRLIGRDRALAMLDERLQ
jgi:lysyl-tRNA synthetase class 1